ncbi:histidine phosphatase family protein [Maricaulis sp.]|uniref:SixA phosphatase family protein n=1 Tax=Maricaulis sp. TaxID=1486257 RepID=UPI00260B3ED1|nr:histidine phosphatase family protein [Maricaulis sp.]
MDRLLILMRHAKAVDRLEAEDDFQRGLTGRGREDSEAAGKLLGEQGLEVDLALVSPAWRTRQTFDLIAPFLGSPPVEDPMALYHASDTMIERAVKTAFDQVSRILVVGHNPGIGALAHMLAAKAGASGQLPGGYPTAAAAAFSLSGEGLDEPKLVALFNPKG